MALYELTEIIQNMRSGENPKITVAIRKRPLNKKELQRNETDIVKMAPPGQVIISEYKQKVDLTKYLQETTFNFDFAYDQHSNNEQIYQQAVRPLIENAFKGAKITCFAYGQTGSGKTYTMKGDMSKNVPGIYYLGAREIFRLLQQPQHRHLQINVTFYQIYCGKLYDLLNNRNILNIREDNKGNINVIGLNQKYICSAQEFLDVIEEGSVLRVTSQNNANDDSSRSHAILQISLKEKNKNFSKISFIDLAGNERGADHMDQRKQTKIDGAEINKSLLSLKECIRALDQGKSHTPFRGSKLTMVLKDSFVGYCFTVMICNVSPNNSSSQNTMNTLRYADRVKELKRSDEGERLSKQQMMSRQLMLPRANNKNCVKINIERGDDDEDIMNKMEMARAMHQNTAQNRMTMEEKMDIEEPYEYKKPNTFGNMGRKTENLSNDVKLFQPKKMQVPINSKTRPNQSEGIPFRGKDLTSDNDKQPLLSRNVKTKIGQNNINTANGNANGFIDLEKRNKLFLPNQNSNQLPQFNVNKTHFQAMNSLRNDLTNYREDHEILFNREMMLIKEELNVKNQYREIQSGGNYEDEIGSINTYLRQMQKMISEKEEIINTMRANMEKIKYEVKNAEGATSKLRYEQNNEYQRPPSNLFNNNNPVSNNTLGGNVTGCRSQTRLYVHSSLNGMQFNGFNNYGGYNDEQLLQGLPGDETINRLF